MEATAQELTEIVEQVVPTLLAIPANVLTQKTPGKWSKQEILGHLIDSAANNHQKFVRTMIAPNTRLAGYDQDAWVAAQHYQQHKWSDMVALWANMNHHLAHIMRQTTPENLQHILIMEGHGQYTLHFLMTDYVEHLKHHVLQILPDAGFQSHFSMTPYV
jgi:hypothetical protein